MQRLREVLQGPARHSRVWGMLKAFAVPLGSGWRGLEAAVAFSAGHSYITFC